MIAWAVRIAPAELACAASLWNVAGVEVCATTNALWLRGPHSDEALDRTLRQLPGASRYQVANGVDLIAAGSVVPSAVMPVGPWQPFRQAVRITLPAPSFPAAVANLKTAAQQRFQIRIERTQTYREPSAILVKGRDFLHYAGSASQVRLRRWTVAVNDSGRVLVRGTPLPSVPGIHLLELEGVLVPAGWHWTPAVDAKTLRRTLQIEPNELALFSTDGTWSRISQDDFVAATRSAVRLSLALYESAKPLTSISSQQTESPTDR